MRVSEPTKTTSVPWRILVVDDEASVHSVLRRVFERMGQTMRGTLSGAEGRALLAEPWDLVLIDKNLPEGSGVELALAARAAHPEAIIILMTAFASRDSAEALVGIVDEYLTKPFDVTYLREIIGALMGFREVGRLARAIAAPGPAPAPAPASLGAAPRTGSSPLPPTPASSPGASPPRSARPLGRGSVALHIVLGDAREEALFLSEARKAGMSASSGPLIDTVFPELIVVDGKSATLELRKAVWSRQARAPTVRVVMVVDSSLADATASLALKASHRLPRPLSPEAVAQLLARLKS